MKRLTIQQHILNVTRQVAEDFFRYVEATSPERLDWSPSDVGQSVISMAREIAVTPSWAYDVTAGVQPTDEERAAGNFEMRSWKNLAKCREEFETRFEIWSTLVLSMTDEQLDQKIFLPFNGGRDHTHLELLEYPRWNITYHLGQVAYIQTLYGDNEVHFVEPPTPSS
jgi:uncharacterized damage-inducible protein DinB